jgi:glycosyltransferase involved in cell wall biosynthesis
MSKAGYLAKLSPARRTIRRLDPDVVHVHYATSYGLLGLASGVRPLVVTAHGDDLLVAPRNPVMARLVSRVLRSADLITVPGQHMKDAAETLLRGRTRPIQVFQYGVESSRLARVAAAARQDAPPNARPLRIVSVRPLLRPYRIDVLLAALALLRGRGVDCVCDIIGSGPESGRLQRLAAQLDLDDAVIFRGQLPEEDVERVLASADVYVSVAETDGTSLALLEALALGAVPVVSDIPANSQWVTHGLTGVVVEIGAESLASGIEHAARLDRERVAEHNGMLVARAADRHTNLAAFEKTHPELHGQAAG